MSGLLTIDVGGTSAAVVGSFGSTPHWEHEVFASPKIRRSEPEIDWLFAGWVNRIVRDHQPTLFAIEKAWIPRDPKRLNISVGRIIGMTRIAMMIAWSHDLKPMAWTIKEVAEHFGAGGLPSARKKARVKGIVEKMWGELSEDEADAAAVWLYCEAKLDPDASRLRGIGELFDEAAMRPVKPKRKREPAQPGLF